MDVAPIPGVNHVKSACYVLNGCDCICLLSLVIMHVMIVAVDECMYWSLMMMQEDKR